MEDVDSSLVQQRPRRAVAVKDYKDHGTGAGADADEDDAKNNSDSDNDSMEDVEVDEDDDDDDDELEEDDDEDEEEGPRRSRRRRIQPVRSSLQGPPARKQRSGPPLRTSSRSTKFTHSMAEPSSTSIRDLFVSAKGRGTPHKSPARRHKQRRRSLADEEPPESSDAESEEEEEEEEEDEMEEEEEGEPMKVQRIIASRTETLQKWKDIGVNMNTTEVTYGSRWFQDSSEKEDESEKKKEDPNAFEERFLVKWANLSFVHVSWETQTDLVDQVDAKSYLTTFFRKSDRWLALLAG